MRKFNKINEAEAQVAEAPVEVQAGKKPTEGLVNINATPGEVLKVICDFKDAEGENLVIPELQKVIKSGLTDGKPTDELITVVGGSAICKDMIPSQLEIGTSASLDDQILNKFGNLDQALKGLKEPVMMKSKPFKGQSEFPVLCFRLGDKVYILDGHHRWSQAYATSPNCQMITAEIKAPGITTHVQALSLCHIILAALYGQSVTKSFGTSENLLDPKVPIDQYIKGVWGKVDEEVPFDPAKRTIGKAKEEVLGKLKAAGLIKEGKEEEAIQMYVKNCKSLVAWAETNPKRFSRIYMPQPGDSGDKTQLTTAPQDAAKGLVNYLNPVKADVKESRVIKTYEKFIQKYKK